MPEPCLPVYGLAILSLPCLPPKVETREGLNKIIHNSSFIIKLFPTHRYVLPNKIVFFRKSLAGVSFGSGSGLGRVMFG